MISSITGKLVEKNPPQVVIDCGGIGYEVDVPMSSFYNLPEVNSVVKLETVFIVREDAQLLYGFLTKAEKQLFKQLLSVNGVGPRTALAILSAMPIDELVNAIATADSSRLVKVPGIGKKTAQRLVLELKDKVAAIGEISTMNSAQADIVAALVSLGFSERDARSVLKDLPAGVDAADGIRLALTKLSK